MKRNVIAVLFSLVSLIATSCSKLDHLFNNGNPIHETRELEQPFRAISMYNNINVKLAHDNHPHLELTCPENLIDKVTTEIEGDTLIIKNENDYNWLRSFDYSIDLTVYYDSLQLIKYASIGSLTSEEGDSIKGVSILQIDTLYTIDTSFNTDGTIVSIDTTMDIVTISPRNFFININEGSGNINLSIDCDVLKNNFNNGTSYVTMSGKAEYTEINMRSYGLIHAENLNSNFVRVQSHSTNDAYVWARTKLTAWLYSIGNVYYKGHPELLKYCTSDGQVIKLNE